MHINRETQLFFSNQDYSSWIIFTYSKCHDLAESFCIMFKLRCIKINFLLGNIARVSICMIVLVLMYVICSGEWYCSALFVLFASH